MKYDPIYIFADRIFIEAIVLDAVEPSITLLVRFADKHGITSLKHLFCQPDQLSTLLMVDCEDADTVLSFIVGLMATNNLGCPEEINVEKLIGKPLTIAHKRLRIYHPLVQNSEEGQMEIDEDLYELDRIMPKLS